MALDRTLVTDRNADDFAVVGDINTVIAAVNNLKLNVAGQSSDDLDVQPDSTSASDRGIKFWMTKSPAVWFRLWWDSGNNYFRFTNQSGDLQKISIADAVQSFHAVTKAQLDAAIADLTTPAGVIEEYSGTALPAGYLWPDGTQVSRTTYARLFAAIGTTFGAGNGTTTFHLPKRNGRVAVCLDNLGGVSANVITGVWADTLGGTFGEESHTPTILEMAAHDHTIDVPQSYAASVGSGGTPSIARIQGTSHTSTEGGGQPFNIVQPSIGMNFIIKY
jgi:microcystin-dependent protein